MLQEDCCTADFAGKHFKDAGQLAAALEKKHIKPASTPQLYAFDHVYSSDPAASFKIWQGGNASTPRTCATVYQCAVKQGEVYTISSQ